MSTSTGHESTSEARIAARVLQEGFGPGAWHGPDLKAALADVTPALAFWRPASGRHNIAEIALHHAYFVRAVRTQLVGPTPEPFVVEGEDWFDASDGGQLSWASIHATVESEQGRLRAAVGDIEAGKISSAMTAEERFALVLGITCHAVYHAGQIQLIKRLHGG
jgi:DinB superfamily